MKEFIAPPYSRQEIIRRATELVRGYAEYVGNDFALLGVNFDVIFEEYIYPEYEIELIETHDLGIDEDGEKVLGFFQPELNRVYIDRILQNDPRRVFTCWHEVGGHAILQGDWLRREINRTGMVREIVTTAPMLSPDVVGTLEWQANLFAAHAAAPSGFVGHVIQQTFGLRRPFRYIGPGQYSFSLSSGTRIRKVGSFSELCNCIAFYIKHRFGGLSVEALSYRVAESRWVINSIDRTAPPTSAFGLKRSSKGGNKWKSHSLSGLFELIPERR